MVVEEFFSVECGHAVSANKCEGVLLQLGRLSVVVDDRGAEIQRAVACAPSVSGRRSKWLVVGWSPDCQALMSVGLRLSRAA